MKVVCFGDSNTYGYDPRSWLGGRYPADSRWVDLLAQKTGWDVVNLGENGRCIPLRPITLPADADLVIVMLGTNDLLQGCTPEKTADRMKRFLQSLPLAPERILLIAPPPHGAGGMGHRPILAGILPPAGQVLPGAGRAAGRPVCRRGELACNARL